MHKLPRRTRIRLRLYRLVGMICLFYLWALCLTGLRFWWLGQPDAGTKALLFGWLALGMHILADLWPFSRLHQTWPLCYFYGDRS
jgi:hypothetical protein